jgi:Leucine-rich repeat (LRR) protein
MTTWRSAIILLWIGLIAEVGSAQCDPKQDSTILASFFNLANGTFWDNKTNWILPGQKINTWYGVKVNAQGCVESIKLVNNALSGGLSPALGNLKFVKEINLTNNLLSGNIPKDIGKATTLEQLLLSQNQFNGPLPTDLSNLVNLKTLSLSQNNLVGSIPSSYGNLVNLLFLYLDNNNFIGSIPSTITQLTQLREFWVNNNKLTGSLPADLGALNKMQKFLVNDNSITGAIPSSVGSMVDLVSFHLSNNKFNGDFPPSIVNCSNLISLQLANNQITGTMPIDIGKITALSTIDINNNMIGGVIPYSLGGPMNLRRIYLANNKFEGCFPKSFKRFCTTLMETNNSNQNGYNFRGNVGMIHEGDFGKWCAGTGVSKAIIAPVSPLCEGSPLTISGSGPNNTYEWVGPNQFMSTTAVNTINPTVAASFGVYTLYVSGDYGCRDTASITVKTVGNITVSNNSPVCEGKEIKLFANGGIGYQWTGPDNFSSTLANPIIPDADQKKEGTYTVKINTGDCIVTRTIDVRFIELGTITTGGDICEGDTLRLFTNAAQQLTTRWTGPLGFMSNQRDPIIPNAQYANAGKYTAVLKDPGGCEYTLSTEIIVDARKKLQDQDFDDICENKDAILLPDTISNTAGKWVGNGIIVRDNMTYFDPTGLSGTQRFTFLATDREGCIDDLEQTITILKINAKVVELSPSTNEDDDNGSALLTIQGFTRNYDMTFTGPKNGGIPSIDSLTKVLRLPSGNYIFTIRDAIGCEDTAHVEIRYTKAYFFMPNIINSNSPVERRLYLKGSNFTEYDMVIYNVWGNPMYEGKKLTLNDNTSGWNTDDSRVSPGVYVYKVTVYGEQGEEVRYGSITVL